MSKVKRTERGWCGHFILAYRCYFRRNTLLEYKEHKIVVSTVGNMFPHPDYMEAEKINCDGYYETMAFKAQLDLGIYWDADVTKEITINQDWKIRHSGISADQEANDMHESIVKEISEKLINGDF